ncbi:MAG: dethiobiotin synthase [Pseudomonadota bacterium]
MSVGVFVTGTDTGVGKTCVATALLTALSAQGWRTAGFKPVAAGLGDGPDAVNDDVAALQSAASLPLSSHQVGPWQLRTACAPHVAAELEARQLPRTGWREQAHALARQADIVVVEGAGGFCVPLSPAHAPRWGLDDVATDIGWPVLLVVGLRLGCLNHALLTAQAIEARGLWLAGWVGNRIDPAMAHADANMDSLRAWLPAPCWGDVPWMATPSAHSAVAALDLPVVARALGLKQAPC